LHQKTKIHDGLGDQPFPTLLRIPSSRNKICQKSAVPLYAQMLRTGGWVGGALLPGGFRVYVPITFDEAKFFFFLLSKYTIANPTDSC